MKFFFLVRAILFIQLLHLPLWAQYTGTGSVSQGIGQTTVSSIYSCPGGRIPNIGTVQATDGSTWVVPAENHFQDAAFPFASDLYNPCTGVLHANEAAALAALNATDVVTVDEGAEIITAYIFSDNYFEMYVNGIPVGKDNVPYTQFNSDIVQFRANRPFQISFLLIDWEEHLGIGTEANGAIAYHAGDGGIVVVMKDEQGNIIATTGNDWKAQTFYTAPVIDLTCLEEIGAQRISSNCVIQDSNNGTAYYGVHWAKPSDWNTANFDDNAWPSAVEYDNATVGVNNKPAYTNFTNVFDAPGTDAQFIWSSNLVLDNEVLVRYTVEAPLNTNPSAFENYPLPFVDAAGLLHLNDANVQSLELLSPDGKVLWKGSNTGPIELPTNIPDGIYFLCCHQINQNKVHKLWLQRK